MNRFVKRVVVEAGTLAAVFIFASFLLDDGVNMAFFAGILVFIWGLVYAVRAVT